MKPRIAITIGDFNGIGPEVALKAISNAKVNKLFEPILVGPLNLFEYFRDKFKIKIEFGNDKIRVIESSQVSLKQIQVGKISPDAGVCAGLSIEKAVSLCLEKEADAMITSPVSKEALHLGGYNFPGQTEMIAMLSRSQQATMFFISKNLRIALATIHIPLKNVSDEISRQRIFSKIETIHSSLTNDFKIKNPKIAILGLNPHAGENGEIGNEEKTHIIPALNDAFNKKINAEGVFSADGFFGNENYKNFDAILAMYHDQGLIPLKLLGFETGVNFTAGIKILRTSPDHGTAFEIAHKGIANANSFIESILIALQILKNRGK